MSRPRPTLIRWCGTQHARRFLPEAVPEDEQHGGCGGRLRLPRRQKAKVGRGCSEGKRQKWEGDAQKAKGKSGKGMLRRQKAKVGRGCSMPFGISVVGIFISFTFCLLPFTFPSVVSVRNPKSKIENPKSCVGPSAILTGSRTRPSAWGSNARFGPVEDRRNNRRLATFTCTLAGFSRSDSPDLVAVTFNLLNLLTYSSRTSPFRFLQGLTSRLPQSPG